MTATAPVIQDEVHTWTAAQRLAASNTLNAVLDDEEGLRAVAEAAAETIMMLLDARALSVVLLDDRGYRDLVNVGELAPGEHRFPEEASYPANAAPAATTRHLACGTYVTLGKSMDLLDANMGAEPGLSIGWVLGVPIVHSTELWGELFMVRRRNQPAFTRADQLVACNLAALFGMRLPPLLKTWGSR